MHIFLRFCVTLTFVPVLHLHAQTYPSSPVRIVVPFPPGGTADPVARTVAAKLSQQLGQQVIVDNRPGGSTIIGSEIVAKATPDGYTLLSAPISYSVNPSLFTKLPYDPLRDLLPVTFLGATPMALVVHPSLPVRTVKEMIALTKAKPGELNYGSAGNGSSNHLTGELFNLVAHVKLVHIPYKGAGPATTALMSGEVYVGFPGLPAAAAHVRSGPAPSTCGSFPSTCALDARLADHDGSGCSGVRAGVVARHHGPGGHACGHRRETQR